MLSSMYSLKNLCQALLPCLLLASCKQELPDHDPLQKSPVPATIDYREETGALSHLVYRATFRYNADRQLVSVNDSLLAPAPGNVLPWVNFFYENGRLAEIVLRSVDSHRNPYDPKTDKKAARFLLTYDGDLVNTRHEVGGQQKGAFTFKLDANGFPVRKNVQYGSVFLDEAGNIDVAAELNAAKARNPLGGWEILDRRFDQNRNIFQNKKELRMLGVILAAYDWNMVTSLVPYLGMLTSNNELSKTLRYCSAAEGCRPEGTVLSETPSLNAQGLPTRRLMPVGVMGRYEFLIKYRSN